MFWDIFYPCFNSIQRLWQVKDGKLILLFCLSWPFQGFKIEFYREKGYFSPNPHSGNLNSSGFWFSTHLSVKNQGWFCYQNNSPGSCHFFGAKFFIIKRVLPELFSLFKHRSLLWHTVPCRQSSPALQHWKRNQNIFDPKLLSQTRTGIIAERCQSKKVLLRLPGLSDEYNETMQVNKAQ